VSASSREDALEALCRTGFGLHQSGRLDEARDCYKKVLARRPMHFNALQLLGLLYLQTGRPELSVTLTKRAILVNPDVAGAHSNLGNALLALERSQEALASFDRAIALAPGAADAHFNRAGALLELERLDEAVASCDLAIALNSRHVRAHINRGVGLQRLRRPDEALASFDRAIELDPDCAEAHCNRGPTLHDLKRPRDALAAYDKAISLKPDYFDALAKRGATLLQLGCFEAGWREYEWRRKWRFSKHILDASNLWSGDENLEDKCLFLYSEQGFGDTIQFFRYVQPLEAKSVNIVLSAQEPLRSIFHTSNPNLQIVGEDEAPANFDYHCPLGSLPLAFRSTLGSLWSPPRYLWADEARRAQFEAKLGPKTAVRIGLAWSGNPAHDNDRNRSIAFEQIRPLLTAGAHWFALQTDIRSSDAAAFQEFGRVTHSGAGFRDFADTAAFIELLDLVITVDTSVAHLAGALGKPVWILLPFNPDWRWMLDRSDSPWYPSARLFRQPALGDWAGAIDAVRGELLSVTG
jgi:tetratricopeptide (TPR) repeat protein